MTATVGTGVGDRRDPALAVAEQRQRLAEDRILAGRCRPTFLAKIAGYQYSRSPSAGIASRIADAFSVIRLVLTGSFTDSAMLAAFRKLSRRDCLRESAL